MFVFQLVQPLLKEMAMNNKEKFVVGIQEYLLENKST